MRRSPQQGAECSDSEMMGTVGWGNPFAVGMRWPVRVAGLQKEKRDKSNSGPVLAAELLIQQLNNACLLVCFGWARSWLLHAELSL